MHLAPSWSEIALRLLLTLIAGAAIGSERSEHNRPAGLRTCILVSLAACIAMLQVNLLLPLAGRSSDSFVMNDLMRLPLGILSGMGFIGAGAIVRRDNFVVGVTTAATLWFLTVIGLCFGGGQIALGVVGAGLGLLVIGGGRFVENRMVEDKQAKLLIVSGPAGPNEAEIASILQQDGFRILSWEFSAASGSDTQEFTCAVGWRAKRGATEIPVAVNRLTAHQGVVRIAWSPQSRA